MKNEKRLTENEVESVSFTNLCIVKTRLSENDYNYILNQILKDKNAKKFVTGLTEQGVANHTKILDKKTLSIIDKYIKRLMGFYYYVYPDYLKTQNQLDTELPLELSYIWANHQKAGELLPLHDHDGIYSFNIWLKIPYDSTNKKFAGTFAFSYQNILGQSYFHNINLTSKDEGLITLFPSKLQHIVYPFYNSKKTRISIAGNVAFSTKK